MTIDAILTKEQFDTTLSNMGACWARSFPIRLSAIVHSVTTVPQ